MEKRGKAKTVGQEQVIALMAWGTRNGNQYYYRSSRRGDKVVTTYFGGGLLGEEAAKRAMRDQTLRANAHKAEKLRRAADREFDATFDTMLKEAKQLAGHHLISLGYRLHRRSEWRKQRGFDPMNTESTSTGLATLPQQAGQLVVHPKEEGRQLNAVATLALADRLCGKEFGEEHEKIIKEIVDRGRFLAGENPSPVESALAQTAALAWGALRVAEFQGYRPGDRTIVQARFNDERIERAQRREIQALKTLAQVRKLGGPSVVVVNQGGTNNVLIQGEARTGLE